jgi:hypothetical protein
VRFAARLDDGTVTGMLGHASIDVARRLYAADRRDAEAGVSGLASSRKATAFRSWGPAG